MESKFSREFHSSKSNMLFFPKILFINRNNIIFTRIEHWLEAEITYFKKNSQVNVYELCASNKTPNKHTNCLFCLEISHFDMPSRVI